MNKHPLSHADQIEIVREASLAPSVHNTQPARWRFDGDAIELYADQGRFLPVGDPELRDASLSCGAAVEGTVMALAARGRAVSKIEDLWETNQSQNGRRLAARITVAGTSDPDPLGAWAEHRFTWRGKFAPASDNVRTNLIEWAHDSDAATLVVDAEDIRWIAKINDQASLNVLSDKPYRDELVSWMRFSESDKRWNTDGLNADAMQLSSLEARAAKIVLSSPTYEIASALKLAGTLVSEKAKTLSASGVVFFHVHTSTQPIAIGRQFYRLWLDLTRLDLVAWPMAVVADDETSNDLCKDRFNLPSDHRLINVFRVGSFPDLGSPQATVRLAAETLIIE